MTKIRCMIIDDEELARKRLLRLLENFQDQLEVIGEARDGQEAVMKCEEQKPQLIFLDIEMPGLNGMEVLNQLSYKPMVVFVTAFDHYAVKAFEKNSLDYLLKPVELQRLEDTMLRLQRNELKKADTETLQPSLLAERKANTLSSTVPVKIGDRILLLPFDQIAYFEAADKYVTMHLVDGKEHLIDYTLHQLEQKLPPHFMRIHRAHIANLQKVKEFRKGFNGAFILCMANAAESKLHTGKTYAEAVRNWLDW